VSLSLKLIQVLPDGLKASGEDYSNSAWLDKDSHGSKTHIHVRLYEEKSRAGAIYLCIEQLQAILMYKALEYISQYY
jgi:hypothetical protein